MNEQKSKKKEEEKKHTQKKEKPKCPSGLVCYVNIETLTYFVVLYEYESEHYTHIQCMHAHKPLKTIDECTAQRCT